MYQKIGSITTNASGYGSYSKYVDASASYYAKETKAPKGYELDETVYTFVNSGKKPQTVQKFIALAVLISL